MRITNIRFTQKANPGNYESIEFAAEAVISEDEDPQEATRALGDFVDWYARKTIRDGQARTYRLVLNDEAAPVEKRQAAQAWLTKYEARKAAVEST